SCTLSACDCGLRGRHSFPTRRSSDLDVNIHVLFRCSRRKLMKFASGGDFKPTLKICIEYAPCNSDVSMRLNREDMKWFNRKTFSDRKSTRLNSSHVKISYAVFCLKKK